MFPEGEKRDWAAGSEHHPFSLHSKRLRKPLLGLWMVPDGGLEAMRASKDGGAGEATAEKEGQGEPANPGQRCSDIPACECVCVCVCVSLCFLKKAWLRFPVP